MVPQWPPGCKFTYGPKSETTVQGVSCKTMVDLHPNGKLKQAYLAESQRIQGVPFREGENVWFYDTGEIEGTCFFDAGLRSTT